MNILIVPEWLVIRKNRGAKTTFIIAYQTDDFPGDRETNREIVVLEWLGSTEDAVKVKLAGSPGTRTIWIPRSQIKNSKQIDRLPERPIEGQELSKRAQYEARYQGRWSRCGI